MMERRPLVAIGGKATDRIRDKAPPQGAASRRSNTIQEGGGAEAEQGDGRRARSMWKWRDWGLRQSGRDKSSPVRSRDLHGRRQRPPVGADLDLHGEQRTARVDRRPPERDSRPPRGAERAGAHQCGADRAGDLHGGAQSRSPPVRSRQGRRPPRRSRQSRSPPVQSRQSRRAPRRIRGAPRRNTTMDQEPTVETGA